MTVLPMAPRQRGMCCTPERRMPAGRVEQLSEILKALSDRALWHLAAGRQSPLSLNAFANLDLKHL